MNFVILDYDLAADLDLARTLGVARHPAFAVLPPGGGPDSVAQRLFGPQTEDVLRRVLDGLGG